LNALSKDEIARIVSKYEARLSEHGFDVAALKSGGVPKQFVRHSLHAVIFDLTGRRVLDVGCGIAMFYRFLRNAGVDIAAYVGIDIVKPFLDYDRKLYPEAQFLVRDIFQEPVEDLAPDVIFMSQLFNARYEAADNENVARAAMAQMFAAARDGVVIDFMTSYVDYREPEHHYFEPEEMLRYAKTLTPFVSLHHDYLPFEFTLALRHGPRLELPRADDIRAYD
jgi:SAM-dependent methyltransferase